ncbi:MULTISPECIES: helix-turn-helix domain-containing protein [unclassified Adlercreutzia]|uniref:helix-turn-helix domain-containing protein n=1 Tax=unclassified Adlercreutzia TaxID=2636013 RepID=UPI0013EAA735|nr:MULTISPECIES: helix-turn-helix transcriptional regulator [unclassified Adlercreutzia]
MNQAEIGSFIAQKRREKNLTQAELAANLGMSNKAVSKWETGKSMPDYAVVQSLCKELGISVSELVNAKEASPEDSMVPSSVEEQILDLMKRTQKLEAQRTSLYGIVLIVMGIALMASRNVVGGSDVPDFFAGMIMGISSAATLVGVYIAARGLAKR